MTRHFRAHLSWTVAAVIWLGVMNNMSSAQDPDWDKIKKEAEAKKAGLDAQKAEADAKKALLDAQKALADAEAAAQAAADPTKKAAAAALAAERAKKDLADAQKAALDSQKALADAQEEPDPAKKATDDKVAAAKAAKDMADAEKSASDAQKAKADASLAALKAQIGEVPDSGIKGEVTVKEKAGILEAHLLAAKALGIAADRLVLELPADVDNKPLLLYASAEVPSFQTLIAYRVQKAIVTKAFNDATDASDDANKRAEPATEIAPLAAAGLGLDAVTKLLGFFRSDYSVGGVEVSLDDSAFVHALAGRITTKRTKVAVQLPALYSAGALNSAGVLSDPVAKIIEDFTTLSKRKSTSMSGMARHDKLSAKFTEAANKATDDGAKAELLKKAKLHKEASDALKSAIELYDNLFSKLTTADDKGLAPFTTVIRETVLADLLLKDNLLLVVKLQKSGGAYYTKKNLWTFFGGMPFYNAGGVVVSYVLLHGDNGNVMASGLIPILGGFVRENKLEEVVNGKATP